MLRLKIHTIKFIVPVSSRLLDQKRLEKLENNIKNFIHLRDRYL